MHNPTLWPEHLENKMMASTPVSACGRSQAAHQTEGACHSPKGGVFRMPSTGDQNLTRVSVSLLDWEGALFSQEKRGIVWTEWLWGIRPTSVVQIYNILPQPQPRKLHRVPQTAGRLPAGSRQAERLLLPPQEVLAEAHERGGLSPSQAHSSVLELASRVAAGDQSR